MTGHSSKASCGCSEPEPQWDKLPRGDSPLKSTCVARFQEWNDRDVFPAVLAQLYELLEEQGLLDLREAFIDGTFIDLS